MIEIKKLSGDNWMDYKNIRLEALQSDPVAFGSSYEEESQFSETTWRNRIENSIFAISDNKPIGMVGFLFNNRLKHKHVADIFGMYVSSKYRNHGIGSKLLDNVILLIKENKAVRKIKLTVNPQQEYAVKLYKKYGFSSIGLSKDEHFVGGKFHDELLMEKFV
jgi:ribosomal protein S18 acetylase RimI-like enzyme